MLWLLELERYLMAKKLVTPRIIPTLQLKTGSQKGFYQSIQDNILTFGPGPAGGGKTYVGTMAGCEMLERGSVDRLVFTRPMVEAGEKIGFLPGPLEEKFAPYFAPILEILEERYGVVQLRAMLQEKLIKIAPIAFLRGHTFKNCFVLFDEAQNTTTNQMRLFLTRIGENAKICVTGDLDQMDTQGRSGMADAMERLKGLDRVGETWFTAADIVRSGLVREIVERYK